MKVLVLSQYCYPEPDLKCFPLAKKLKEQGFDVEILTGYPSHPFGEIYSGYKMKMLYSEFIESIKVIRVPLFIDHSTSKIKRVINYISFAISASIIGIIRIKKPDVIYVYHGAATIAIPAIFIKLIYNSKIFYDINDYWPDSISASGMITNKSVIRLIGIFCKYSYRFFDNINVVSEGYKKKLLDLNVPENRISVIYNWPLEIDNLKSKKFLKYKKVFIEKFTVVYAGNIGKAQSLIILVKTAMMLKRDGINDVVFFLIGNGLEKELLIKEIEKLSLQDYFIFTGTIEANYVGEFLEAANILLLHLNDDPLFEITIPSKLGNYFCIGKAILCGVRGEAAEMVSISKSGFCFRPEDHSDLYEKLITIKGLPKEELDSIGKNGKIFFKDKISFEIGSQKMIRIFENLIDYQKPLKYS